MSVSPLLDEIGLLPPPLATPWEDGAESAEEEAVPERWAAAPPLFWYDPPWHFVPAPTARQIASTVDAVGIPTAALGCELGEEDIGDVMLRHSIAAVRPDRYGLAIGDLNAAAVVDLRLARSRDAHGRFAYGRSQLQRWLAEPTGEDETLDLPDSVPAPGWPPELTSLGELAGKFRQYRAFQRRVRCAVSITPYRIFDELAAVLEAKPDIVILRMDDSDEFSGIRLASVIAAALDVIRTHHRATRLWVVPPCEPTPDDCVKMLALGVEAVAVDWWCQPLINAAIQQGGTLTDAPAQLREHVLDILSERMERMVGLIHSCGASGPAELRPSHLYSPSTTIARRLGISSQT
ncbi:hypothetical protein [Roseimaritima sediminicola]|uniref:hypothetical protein n=1 Tax=Roseimaritima sediminicola TaxID=2662066 RepID=UPI0012982FD0|nr:hypothetical protein [Roseimaritima sediminicola]